MFRMHILGQCTVYCNMYVYVQGSTPLRPCMVAHLHKAEQTWCGYAARRPPVQQDVQNIWRPNLTDPDAGSGSEEDVQCQAWFLPCFLELIKLAKEYIQLLLFQSSKQGAQTAGPHASRSPCPAEQSRCFNNAAPGQEMRPCAWWWCCVDEK